MPTRGGNPPMSARRVALVHGGSGVASARRASMLMSSGKSCGRSNCSNRKNPCASSSSGVALSSSTCRPRPAIGATARQAASPGCPGGRRRRCASSTTSRSMPARTAWSVNSGRSISISIEITARRCSSNGLKSSPKSLRDVGKAIRVEQREHLVILPPQLAKPLDGQGVGRHHQAARDLAGVHEPVQDQRRLDGLAEADFVGQQPANRIGARWRARPHTAGAGRAGRGRRETIPARRPRAGPAGAGC